MEKVSLIGQSNSNNIYQLFLATILCPDGETPATKLLEEWPKITFSPQEMKCKNVPQILHDFEGLGKNFHAEVKI